MKKIGHLILQFLLFYAASIYGQQKIEQWDRFELEFELEHPYPGNSFSDVNLTATFTNSDTSFFVSGLYDGNNTFKLRFMPQQTGRWNYTTSSNIAELDNQEGSFECVNAVGTNHGMVKVSDTYNFKYADGKQYYPFGTTLYNWTHMSQELQEETLNTLKNAAFNKVRMCVFPHRSIKPELFPFIKKEASKNSKGKETTIWDYEQFNPVFFQHLEKRVDDLARLGIEADIILFHPYDDGRWGFDSMPMDANLRYIKYLTSRLSSFRNVWWSIANEYDFVKAKTLSDWDLLSKKVVQSDPYRHLCSIHGSTATYYEYWKPEFTHISIQDNGPVETAGSAAILRNVYAKPIIYDEVNYEGNIGRRWGRLSGEEMLDFVWNGVIAGTYVTHGESFKSDQENAQLFIIEGGAFRGSSWKRIDFLRKIIEEGPGPLQMADISRDSYTSTAGKGYYIIYLGKEMHSEWLFNLPVKNASYERLKADTRFKVEIIDAWDMTIQTWPAIFETSKEIDYRMCDKNSQKVRLPLKPYIALRVIEISD